MSIARSFRLLGLLLFGLGSTSCAMAQAPTYADAETRHAVNQMLDAHGGVEAWHAARTLAFDHILYMPRVPPSITSGSPWMISHEVFDRTSGEAYADYPLWESQIASDGEKTWSINWTFPNPPQQMLRIHYQLTFLPWLTQQPGAQLEHTGTGQLPGDDKTYETIGLAYEQGGPTWVLYVDPQSHQMKGFEVTFAPGFSAHHVIRGYTATDGLLIPTDWTTHAGPERAVIGYHAILNVHRNPAFDRSRMRIPSEAVVAETGR